MNAATLAKRFLESDEDFDVEDIMSDAAIPSYIAPILLKMGFEVTERSQYEKTALDNSHKAVTYVTYFEGPTIPIFYGPRGARKPEELQLKAGTWSTPLWRTEDLRLEIVATFATHESGFTNVTLSRYEWMRNLRLDRPDLERTVERRIERVIRVLKGRNVGSRTLLDRAIREALRQFMTT